MRICYFGLFDPEYERNRVLISGLRQNGVDLKICSIQGKGIGAYCRLMKLWWGNRMDFDLVIVGYSDRRFSVLLARAIFRCPIVWDAFYSSYDSYVNDRKIVAPVSLKALYHWSIDWLGCRAADRIILDTDAHINYFVKTFLVKREKFICSLVGASDDIFYPTEVSDGHTGFHVLFFGNFIPLQGVQFIIRAAKLLERNDDIKFDIIGNGQTYHQVRALASELQVKNIFFHEHQSIYELARSISQADLCLGIFGDTEKAQRVIPNKVYEAIAMGRPVLTADTPAIRELFTDRQDILFCRGADPTDLADKISLLYDDTVLRSHIAAGGRATYQVYCTPSVIGVKLIRKLGYTP